MQGNEKVYRCGQCSRLDAKKGRIVDVVSTTDIRKHGLIHRGTVESEETIMLCEDCYREVFPSYGKNVDI